MVLAEEEEISFAMKRFLEVNEFDSNDSSSKHLFVEAYNIGYALKVLIR